MVRHNHNEAITLPVSGLPVLLPSSSEKADGRVVGYAIQNGLQRPVESSIRVLPLDALYQLTSSDPKEHERFAKEHGQVPEPWRLVLVDIACAAHEIAHGTRERAQSIIREHLQDQGDFERLAAANPKDWIVRTLSDGLRKPQGAVQFVLWWNDKADCLSAGLLCPDARTAAFALLLGATGQASGLGVCSRCGNPFPALRGGQRYCSSRCQTAAAMARYRANLKQRNSGATIGVPRKRKSARKRAKSLRTTMR
jgi:hypothetical protein